MVLDHPAWRQVDELDTPLQNPWYLSGVFPMDPCSHPVILMESRDDWTWDACAKCGATWGYRWLSVPAWTAAPLPTAADVLPASG